MEQRPAILLISQPEKLIEDLAKELEQRGFTVTITDQLETSLEQFQDNPFDTIIFDLQLFNQQTLERFRLFRDLWAMTPVVFLGSPDNGPSFHELRGPFALVDKTDAFGVMLDRLFDILQFFTSPRKGVTTQPIQSPSDAHLSMFDQRLVSILTAIKNMASVDKEKLYALVLTEIAKITEAKGGSLFSFENGALVLKYSLDPGHVPQSISLPLKPKSPFDMVVTQSKPLLIKDIRGSKSLAHSGWKGYNDGSLMVIPLMDANLNIFSLISLHNKHTPPFNERDLELGRMFSSLISQLIDIRETHGDKHYKGILSEAPIGLILFDANGKIYEVNNAFSQISGYSEDQCFALNYWELTPEKFRLPEQTILQELSSLNRPCKFEKDLIKHDQSFIPVRLRYSLFKSVDGNLYLASVESYSND